MLSHVQVRNNEAFKSISSKALVPGTNAVLGTVVGQQQQRIRHQGWLLKGCSSGRVKRGMPLNCLARLGN